MIGEAKLVMSEFVYQNTHKKNKDTSDIDDIDSSDEDELDSILKARSTQPSIIPSPAHKKKASKIVVIVDFSTNTPAQRIRQEAIDLAIVAAEEEKERKAFS